MEPTSALSTQDPGSLPDDFVFSQSSLQAYVDCKRRFWLSYLKRIPWPAPPASPAGKFEQVMRLGAAFHRMIQRYEEGIALDTLATGAEFPLGTWIRAYVEHRPADLPSSHIEVERTLQIPICHEEFATRLIAKYDLIAADGQRTVIMDWKTGSKLIRPAVLQQKMQSSVYPYVLVEAGNALPWGPVQPEQVEMRYWFVAAPEQPVVFRYDAHQHATNGEKLVGLISDILSTSDKTDFPKVADTPFARKYVCGFCNYRGLCDRGTVASDIADLEQMSVDEVSDPGSVLDFGLEDVDEIPF